MRVAREPADSLLVGLDVDSTGVATLSLDDVAGQNTMSEPLVAQLIERLHEVAVAPQVKVVVLKGLPQVFSGGASRELLDNLMRGEVALSDILLPRAMFDLPVPTIAALEGHAIGGGLALGLCADLVLIARESRYGCSFMNMGFTPGMGMTRLLEHLLAPAMAHEMLFTGQAFKGAHFEGRSGFNYILPRAEVLPKAYELAGRIAEKPRVAVELLKRALSLGRRQLFEATRTIETFMHQISFAQTDAARLVAEHYGTYSES
jgi:4-carboxy-3-alkylbut-2-enoyl-[acp] decarboxylase